MEVLWRKLNNLKLYLTAKWALRFRIGQRKCSCIRGPARNNNREKLICVSRTLSMKQLWSTNVINVRLAVAPFAGYWRAGFSKSRGLSLSVSFLPFRIPTRSFFGSGSIFASLGVRHAILAHERLLNWKTNSFPIVRKYQLEIFLKTLLKSKCWQAKHIRTSSVECDTWPKIFVPDENLGDIKRWVVVSL